MRLRHVLPFFWFLAACRGAPVIRAAPPPPAPVGPTITATTQAEPPSESALDPARWIRVHTGSALLPVPGTALLRDETGSTWYAAQGGVLEKTTSGLEPFLTRVRDPSGTEHERRLKWVVGDAQGLRYAFVDEATGPCDAVLESLLLEQSDGKWRPLALKLRDPSAPEPLRDKTFTDGFALIDSENSCGHGGRPFDYTLVTHPASELWPSPQRFSAPFLFGRRTFSTVAFETFTVTPRGEVVVFGLNKGVDAAGELADRGMALEIFRPSAKASDVVPVPDELGVPDFPELIASSDALMLRARNALDELTYKEGHWSRGERAAKEEDTLFERLDAELRAHPLLLDDAPFTLSHVALHAGLRWFSGTAGDRPYTFVDGSARWRSGAPATSRESAR
jgi:hypothetical protein